MIKEQVQAQLYAAMDKYGRTDKRTLKINRKLDKIVNKEQRERMGK